MPDDAWTAKADDREPRPWKEIPNVPQPFSQHRPSGGFAVPAECPIPAKEQTWQLETNGRRWVGSATRIAVTAGSGWLAKLTPATGHTLLEVFLLTKAGFKLVNL